MLVQADVKKVLDHEGDQVAGAELGEQASSGHIWKSRVLSVLSNPLLATLFLNT